MVLLAPIVLLEYVGNSFVFFALDCVGCWKRR
ncbi:hypothetical protein ACVIF9_008020 [Bradyrhizobium sp. USDA 4350]